VDYAPIARIAARYIIGTVAGAAVSDAILNDPDLLNMLTMAISTAAAYAVEKIYAIAKARGWAT
jgi:hypothetical protein